MVDQIVAGLIQRINSQPHDQGLYLILADRLEELELYAYAESIRLAAKGELWMPLPVITQPGSPGFVNDSPVFPETLFPYTRTFQKFNRFGVASDRYGMADDVLQFSLVWQVPTEERSDNQNGFICRVGSYENWRIYGPNILRHYGRPVIRFSLSFEPMPYPVGLTMAGPCDCSAFQYCFWHDAPFMAGRATSQVNSSAVVPAYIWGHLKKRARQDSFVYWGAVFSSYESALNALRESMLDWAQEEASIPLYAKADSAPDKPLELVGPGSPSQHKDAIQLGHRMRCLNPLINYRN